MLFDKVQFFCGAPSVDRLVDAIFFNHYYFLFVFLVFALILVVLVLSVCLVFVVLFTLIAVFACRDWSAVLESSRH